MKQRLMVALGLGLMLVSFQNCWQTEFSAATGDGEVVAKGSLTEMPLDASDSGSSSSSSVNDESSGQIQQPAAPTENPGKKNGQAGQQGNGQSCDSDKSEGEDEGLVACILVRSGKSLKLGYIDDSLQGVMAVSQSVCISPKACTDIVSKKFEVVGPFERGYCAHNPHIVRLSDAQVQALIDKK